MSKKKAPKEMPKMKGSHKLPGGMMMSDAEKKVMMAMMGGKKKGKK